MSTPTWAAVISGQVCTYRPSFWFLQTGSHSVVLADLERTDTPLPLPPKGWD